MSAEVEALWQRLSNPQSPDFILAQPDYYCLLSPMLSLGQMPK